MVTEATAPARAFQVSHVQLGRALFAAVAAVMVTFSPDHSAPVGLAIFSGWAIATALILFAGAWLAYPRDRRATPVAIGALTLLAGMLTGLPALRTTTMFFVVVIIWALLTGIIELISGIRGRRAGHEDAADAILIGAITLALGLGLLLVNPAYSLEYFIKEADATFTLTGIVIGVGIFGGYAAVIAVFLGIAGFSPRRHVAEITEAPAAGRSAGESA